MDARSGCGLAIVIQETIWLEADVIVTENDKTMMSWEAVATFALLFVTLVGMNLGAIRWLLTRNEADLGKRILEIKREGSDFSHLIERELMQLKATMPVEYVRREDWIRFSNTLEAKIDAMRRKCARRLQTCAPECISGAAG